MINVFYQSGFNLDNEIMEEMMVILLTILFPAIIRMSGTCVFPINIYRED